MSSNDHDKPKSEQELARLKKDWLATSGNFPSMSDLRILERCREIAAGSLSGALKGTLEKLVDEFFALADKAVQAEAQNLYFEAMSVARDQHVRLEQAFRRHFIRGFDTAVSGANNSVKNANLDDECEFSLVDADELEESIAIQEMTAKMKAGGRDELVALEKRMGILLHDANLSQHKNPIGAEILADAFVAACGETNAPLKVRLLFVTMWDRHMQNGVLSTYHEVNQYLVEKGILPKFKHEVAKRASSEQVEQIASVAAQAAVQAIAMTEEGGDVFETMRHLLSASTMRKENGEPVAGLAVLHNPLVLTQLTQLQHQPGLTGTLTGAVMADLGGQNMLRELKASELGSALGSTDIMTIDIVAMLFDFIFDDKRVPDAIKALLGRLQIPVLKAAMLDQAFFSRKNHPTRRLLNTVAEAAYEWGVQIDHDSPLYCKVEELVQRIVEDFEDNLAVFELALVEFEQFLAEREQDADRLVNVSKDMIEARERAQIKAEDAQEAAEDAVRARASDGEVPDAVRLFLCQEWIKPLRDAYLDGGGESPAWLAAVGLMDDLIWSVRPKLTRESRQYMVKTLPGLLRRLQEGMKSAQIEQQTRERFMSQLVHCHASAVKAGFQSTTEVQPLPEEAWKAAVLARQDSQKQKARESAVVLPFARPTLPRDERDVKLEIIQAQNDSGQLEVEQITIANLAWHDNADEQMDVTQDIPEDLQVTDEESARQMVADLKPGVWVEFTHGRDEPLRARLKWISPLKSAYLFTDGQGKRAATMPLHKLEAAFRIGSARLVEEIPLLDRAVDNVIETLKKAVA